MFGNIISFISVWAIPFLLFIVPLLAIKNKVKVYESFIDGAKGGFDVAVKIIPYLVGEDNDKIIERATICKNGDLTTEFEYLRDYLNGN